MNRTEARIRADIRKALQLDEIEGDLHAAIRDVEEAERHEALPTPGECAACTRWQRAIDEQAEILNRANAHIDELELRLEKYEKRIAELEDAREAA